MNVKKETAIDWCKQRRVCNEAIEWLETLPEDATMADAWLACHRGDWMLWALSRCEHVDEYRETIKEMTNTSADRAVRAALAAIEGIDEAWAKKWRTWATGWLSGEDRSYAAAEAAADASAHAAAWAAAWAAGAAARAAGADWAAYAAAWAARATACAAADASAADVLHQDEDIRKLIPEWPDATEKSGEETAKW